MNRLTPELRVKLCDDYWEKLKILDDYTIKDIFLAGAYFGIEICDKYNEEKNITVKNNEERNIKVKDLVEKLPKDIKQKFYNNLSKDKENYLKLECLNLSDIIYKAFEWRKTKEGVQYWNEISNGNYTNARKILKNKEIELLKQIKIKK